MQTRNAIDGIHALQRQTRGAFSAPAEAASLSSPVPLDAIVIKDRRAIQRFVPVAAQAAAQSLAGLRQAPARLLAPTMPLPLAATVSASPPAASPALRIAADLQCRGFHLLYKRRFWIPLLMDRYVPLTPEAFVRKSDEGCSRLALASTAFHPVPVRGLADLQALDAFYLGGTACAGPSASLVATLGSLYRNGYSFTQERSAEDVGPYGAFVAIEGGGTVSASRYGDGTSLLRTATDAARVEFFRVGGLNPSSLPHADEARTLQGLEDQQHATMFIAASSSIERDAEQAWQALFGRASAPSVWAGSNGTPLVELTPSDLLDGCASGARVQAAMADYTQMMNMGIPAPKGRATWKALSPPVAAESFNGRIGVMQQLLAACGKDVDQALDAFSLLRTSLRPGDNLVDAATGYCAVRSVVDTLHHDDARVAWLRIRDHLDEALPGLEPPDEKCRLYLQLLGAVQRSSRVEELWRQLDSGDPRSEQVDVFVALHRLEKGFGTAAETDYGVLLAMRDPGEKLSDVYVDFAAVRRYGRDFEPSSAATAFQLLRRNLAQTAPGPWTDAQRRAMFTDLLATVKNCEVACRVWTDLGQAGPGSELESRVSGWVLLYGAEDEKAHLASKDMASILALREPGESVDDAVKSFLDVRARLPKGSSVPADDAFRFIRTALDRTLVGPWTTMEKKEMYLELLGALGDHPTALKTWKRMAPDHADFPQRLQAFVALVKLEGSEAEARKSYDMLLREQRVGEALVDTLKAYVDVRSRVHKHDTKQGRSAFHFIRQDLPASLPGPWTQGQREEMYLRVLDDCKSQETAEVAWMDLTGGKSRTAVGPDFPQRLASWHALYEYEGDVPSSLGALAAIEDVLRVRPSEKLDDLVGEYLALRPFTSDASADEGILLFRRMHCELEDAEKAPFLKLQRTTGALFMTDDLWRAVGESKLPLAEAVDLVCESLTKTRSLTSAHDDLTAVATCLRPGETVTQAATALDTVRRALPLEAPAEAAMIFSYMRRTTPPVQEPLFLSLVRKARGAVLTIETWDKLVAAGSDRTFELRARLLVAQEPAAWQGVLERMRKLDKTIPEGVDRDRAASAMLFVAALPDANAIKRVLARFGATPGSDRTAALEWLCSVMTAAGDLQGFDQAWADVHRAGAPGTMGERQSLFGQLLDATRGSDDGFDVSLDFLRRLDRLPEAGFSSAAMSALALAGAMRGQAEDAERAFEYILDAREQGSFAGETLDATLTRFAVLYAASRSLETALSRLEQTKGAGKVERQDGEVIIGGVRVPRARTPEAPRRPGLYGWFKEQLEKRTRH